jgi:hypothetical protein
MNNIKDYRDKELKMYILACVFVLLCFSGKISFSKETKELLGSISDAVNGVIISAVLFIFTFISDSLFTTKVKSFIINLCGIFKFTGEVIFTRIKDKDRDIRFTNEAAQRVYEDIYKNMPADQKERYLYENEQWFKIYSKYRDVSVIYFSNRDYLLCRDMVFATISIGAVYILSSAARLTDFDYRFYIYLGVMLVINFLAARSKLKEFVYNVIAYDIGKNAKENQKPDEASQEKPGEVQPLQKIS